MITNNIRIDIGIIFIWGHASRPHPLFRILNLKKIEFNLTQNGLPQLQDLYHSHSYQCRVRAFKFPIWHDYLHKSTQMLPKC